MITACTQNKLVPLLKNNDPTGIRIFVSDYSKFIYSVCYSVLLRQDIAEEATQDAMLKILKSIASFDTNASFKAWCYTISYRTAIDYRRRNKNFVDLDATKDVLGTSDADSLVSNEDLSEGISKLLSVLDEEARQVITLFYLEEKNIKEVMEVMELTESNVKIKLFRARKEMAKHREIYLSIQ